MLKLLEISKSNFYSIKTRKISKQKQRKEKICQEIRTIYNESFGIYGAPKIFEVLKFRGIKTSKRTVSNYMKEMKIKAKYIKPYICTTINSCYSTNLENILNRNFNPEKPNAVWCTDITYIWSTEGFIYLTSIMDLFSRKIIAWTLSKTLEVEEVLRCLEQAKKGRDISKTLIIQSDRGSHYISQKYRELTDEMVRSYSRKSTPWDNACIESFHALIKREWLNDKVIINYEHAYNLVFEYIETFYNTVRIHSHCEYNSPNEYEKKYYSVN